MKNELKKLYRELLKAGNFDQAQRLLRAMIAGFIVLGTASEDFDLEMSLASAGMTPAAITFGMIAIYKF